MSTKSDAVSRAEVLDVVGHYIRWNSTQQKLIDDINQLPPVQPSRSREELERAKKILATRYSSKRGVGELIAMADYCLGKENYLAKLFAEQEEKTDGNKTR